MVWAVAIAELAAPAEWTAVRLSSSQSSLLIVSSLWEVLQWTCLFLLWVGRKGKWLSDPCSILASIFLSVLLFFPFDTVLGIDPRALYVVGKYSSMELCLPLALQGTGSLSQSCLC